MLLHLVLKKTKKKNSQFFNFLILNFFFLSAVSLQLFTMGFLLFFDIDLFEIFINNRSYAESIPKTS